MVIIGPGPVVQDVIKAKDRKKVLEQKLNICHHCSAIFSTPICNFYPFKGDKNAKMHITTKTIIN
jgi:hypothetical protein